MKKVLAAIALCLGLTTTLTFSAAPAVAAPLTKLTVMLEWFVNPDHAPLIVAQEKGYFKAEGLEVSIVAPADPNDSPKLVAAGKADLAVDYQPHLYLQAAQGLPLIRVGTLIPQPLNSLMVLEDSGITSIAQLKGKKIGYSVSGFEEALLGTMLKKHGLTLQDVELINVNFSLSPALLTKRVDAIIGAFRNFEGHQIALEGKKARVFLPEQEGMPQYDELIFIANKNTLEAKKPALQAFLRAITKATADVKANPEAGFALFKKTYPENANPLNTLAWKDTIPLFSNTPATLDVQRYQTFLEYVEQQGLVKKGALKVKDVAVDLTPQ